MVLQGILICKNLGANFALKQTFARMCPQMVREGLKSAELFLANSTVVWILSRVQHVVAMQMGGLDEAHLANVAFKRTFARVRSRVLREVGRTDETLIANVTLERTFSRMRPHMDREGVPPFELFLANFAPMRLLSRVYDVVLQGGEISFFILERVRQRPESATMAPSRRATGTDGR